MQFGMELVLFSNFAIILISAIVGYYLIHLWYRQENRLMTDLPLVFAISVMSNAINMVMIMMPIVGDFTPSMEYFRIRSVVIGASVVPMIGALFQIWLPSIKKYHNRLLLLFAGYWGMVVLLGSTQEFIMMMCIPLLIASGIVIGATFVITWKTGRLTELRSDIMIISVIVSMGSQILRMSLSSTPLFYIPDVLLMISFILIGLGFAVPNRARNKKKREEQHSRIQQSVDISVSA